MKKPSRVLLIGPHGVGKSTIAKEMAAQEKNAGVIELTKYDSRNKFFHSVGKLLDRIAEKGTKEKHTELIILGYGGHAALSPHYRIRKEKGKDKMIYVRSVPYDIEELSRRYGKGKAVSILKKTITFLSATPKPDSIVLLEARPETELERIKSRPGKPHHETVESLREAAKIYSELAEKAKKQGIKVFRIDTEKK